MTYRRDTLGFSYAALLPKSVRNFVFNWILYATIIRIAFGFAETKSWVALPFYGEEAILVGTFFFALIVAMRSDRKDQDEHQN